MLEKKLTALSSIGNSCDALRMLRSVKNVASVNFIDHVCTVDAILHGTSSFKYYLMLTLVVYNSDSLTVNEAWTNVLNCGAAIRSRKPIEPTEAHRWPPGEGLTDEQKRAYAIAQSRMLMPQFVVGVHEHESGQRTNQLLYVKGEVLKDPAKALKIASLFRRRNEVL